METIDAETGAIERVEREIFTLADRARGIVIDSNDAYRAAGEFMLHVKAMRGEVDNLFGPVVHKAHEAHKAAVAARKKVDDPLSEAERIIKPKMATYHEEQERKRREEEARAREAARIDAEERQLAEAEALESAGDKAGADMVLSQPVAVPPVVRPDPVAKVDGVSYSDRWTAEVFDFKALVAACAAGTVPMNMLMPDQPALNKAAAAMKEMLAFPGVRVCREKIVRAGRGQHES